MVPCWYLKLGGYVWGSIIIGASRLKDHEGQREGQAECHQQDGMHDLICPRIGGLINFCVHTILLSALGAHFNLPSGDPLRADSPSPENVVPTIQIGLI